MTQPQAQPQTQLDRIELLLAAQGAVLNSMQLRLATISTKETAIMSEQDQAQQAVDDLTAEEQANTAAESKFRTDVEAYIAANPGAPNLSALQAAVDANKQEAAAQTADDASVQPPAGS